ncbi:MAG TPA: hypothetical protein VJ808_06130 [Gemmatimonadales bacterium]|nr:hypothetical protein [Gemmatimonadales bacterium]
MAVEDLLPGGLQPSTIANTGRAGWLAPTAPEASLEVLEQGWIMGADLAPL